MEPLFCSQIGNETRTNEHVVVGEADATICWLLLGGIIEEGLAAVIF